MNRAMKLHAFNRKAVPTFISPFCKVNSVGLINNVNVQRLTVTAICVCYYALLLSDLNENR